MIRDQSTEENDDIVIEHYTMEDLDKETMWGQASLRF